MTDFEATDFFRDASVVEDPFWYFDEARGRCPVYRESHHDVTLVTGYEEARAVYHDNDTFSSATSVTGPFPGFPVALEGDDVSDLIEEHRDGLPFSDQLVTFDPPRHTQHRALLMRLLTPKRLKENEDFMWRLADRQIDEITDGGECEFIADYCGPFTMLVVADLLGVPESDHDVFRRRLGRGGHVGSNREGGEMTRNPLEFLYEYFSTYIAERRLAPKDDVLSRMATATYPDGSVPDVSDVTHIAANLFAAGQETTTRLLGSALQILCDRPELQQVLREERGRIPNFVEETLRYESPVKGDFRLSRFTTTVGGVTVPGGSQVMVLNGAANRDPRQFECPDEFRVDRQNAREHLAFGHGVHFCAGAHLARAEARITIERLLDRMSDITVSEAMHGPIEARRYQYAPTFILRGLTELHLVLTPAS
jgi:cytochrome P450 family 150 subfamily A5